MSEPGTEKPKTKFIVVCDIRGTEDLEYASVVGSRESEEKAIDYANSILAREIEGVRIQHHEENPRLYLIEGIEIDLEIKKVCAVQKQ